MVGFSALSCLTTNDFKTLPYKLKNITPQQKQGGGNNVFLKKYKCGREKEGEEVKRKKSLHWSVILSIKKIKINFHFHLSNWQFVWM